MASLFPTPSPTLPDFESILIHGEYHTSAPLHLILSHCARNPKSRAVLITPSRQRFKEALQHFNDEWLRAQGCYMSTSIISERVKILFVYPSHTE